MQNKTTVFCLTLLLLLSSCAPLNPYYEKPEFSVDSFTLVSAESLSPVFDIGLRVINPNKQPLKIEGLSYSATVRGEKVLTGVSNQPLTIAGYGEEVLKLQAKASLLSGIKLLSDTLKTNALETPYTLRIKMDLGGFAVPIVVTKTGTFSLAK